MQCRAPPWVYTTRSQLSEVAVGRKKTISDMNAVVHEDAEKYRDLDAEHSMNPSGGTPECGNYEAMEDLFVAATAHWFTEQMKLPFQHLIYAPNRKTELRCGFDLSVAPVNSEKLRLRIQNKISATWCDIANTIPFVARDRPKGAKYPDEYERFRHQLRLACGLFTQSAGRSYPYLLVQQCYCLHDYRRMGRDDLKAPIPALDHELRSMAIDLANGKFIDAANRYEAWRLEIATDPANKRATCRAIMPEGDPIPLEVRSLNYLLDQLRDH
jgi:hypothetical protein